MNTFIEQFVEELDDELRAQLKQAIARHERETLAHKLAELDALPPMTLTNCRITLREDGNWYWDLRSGTLEGDPNEQAIPAAEPLCDDEGCDHFGTPHICISPRHTPAQIRADALREAAALMESNGSYDTEYYAAQILALIGDAV